MLQEHTINKYSIRITAPPFIKEEVIYRNIEQGKEKLLKIINDIFTNYFPEDSDIEIDRIELDIGNIPNHHFSDLFNQRVEQLLVEEIKKLVIDKEFNQYIQQNNTRRLLPDRFQLLKNFLEQGFNSHLQANTKFDPDDFILALFDEESEKLFSLFRENSHRPKIRKRLLQLKPETLAKLKELIPSSFFDDTETEQIEYAEHSAKNIFENSFRAENFSDPANFVLLVNEVLHRWKEKEIRFKIAYHMDLIQLENLTQLLWSAHYSYPWWAEAEKKVAFFFKSGNSEKQRRNLYLLYFEFLSAYQDQQWQRKQFDTLLAEGLTHFLAKEKSYTHSEDVDKIVIQIFPEGILAAEKKAFPALLISQEQSLQEYAEEIHTLAQYGSQEDVQLYFEYYLDEGKKLREWFYGSFVHYDLWTRLWEYLSASQLERMVSVLIPAHVSAIKELLDELKLFFSLSINLPANTDVLYRKSILILLKNIHGTNYSITYDTLSQQLIREISKEANNLEGENINSLYFPNIAAAYETRYSSIEQRSEEEISILSFESFEEIIKEKFPATSDFLLLYISALKESFYESSKYSRISFEDLYIRIYHYLSKNHTLFSVQFFVGFVKKYLSQKYTFSNEELSSNLLKLVEDKIALGASELYVLRQVLLSEEKDESNISSSERHTSLSPSDYQSLKETIVKESRSARISFVRKTIIHYLVHSEISYNEKDPESQKAHFFLLLKKLIASERSVVIDLLRELIVSETKWERLLSAETEELCDLLLKGLAAERYEEFIQWNRKTLSFLSWAYPEVRNSELLLLTNKTFFKLLFKKSIPSIGIFDYLELFVTHLKNHPVISISVLAEAAIRYHEEKKDASLFVQALQQTSLYLSDESGINAIAQKPETKPSSGDRIITDFSIDKINFLLNSNASKELQLYIEYYLTKEGTLSQLFRHATIAPSFWPRITFILTESQLERIALQIIPGQYSYSKELREEIKLFLTFHNLTKETERILRKNYAMLFSSIQEQSGNISHATISRAWSDFLLSSDEKTIATALQKELFWKPISMKQKFPKLFALIREVHDENSNLTDSSKSTVTSQEVKTLIENNFPSLAGFISTYISVVEESSLPFIKNKESLVNLYAIIYAYLAKKRNTFSPVLFVKEITALIAASNSMEQKTMGAFLLKTGERLVLEGKHSVTTIKEILHSQGYESEEFIQSLPSVLSPDEYQKIKDETNPYNSEHLSDNTTEDPEKLIKAIEEQYPALSGFIQMYLKAVEQASLPVYTNKSSLADFILAVYAYLKKNATTFSSVSFVKEITALIAASHSLDQRTVGALLLKSTKQLIQKGYSRFDTLKEILLTQEYESAKFIHATPAVMSFEEYQHLKNELRKQDQIISGLYQRLDEFKALLEIRYPSLAGFIFMYLQAVEQSTLPVFKSTSSLSDLFVSIYDYLAKKNKETFSSSSFVMEMTASISFSHSIEQKVIATSLLKSVEEQIHQGFPRFATLKEIIQALGYESANFLPVKPAVLSQGEHQSIKKELDAYHHNSPVYYSLEELKNLFKNRYPASYDFISAYLTTVEMSSFLIFKDSKVLSDLYVKAYAYLMKNEATGFSEQLFVKEFTAIIASEHSLEQNVFGLSLLSVANAEVLNGFSNFNSVKAILSLQDYESEKFVQTKPPVSSSEEYQKVKNELNRYNRTLGSVNFNNSYEIRNVLEKQYPSFAGFISMYVTVLEQSSLSFYQNQSSLAELYVLIYAYLVKNEGNFSSVSFVKEITAELAAHYRVEEKSLGISLLQAVEEKIRQGVLRFEVLREILWSQGYEVETFVPSTPERISLGEYQQVKDEISKHHKSLKFDTFRKTIGYYIQHGSYPDSGEEAFRSLHDFKIYLKEFFQEYKGDLIPLLKELLSSESLLKNLTEQKDAELNQYILIELSGGRDAEFLEWKKELELFLEYSFPEANKMVIQIATRQALFNMLLHKDRITVGLFSYLELAFENLKNKINIHITSNFSVLIEKYKEEKRGIPLFVMALERLDFLLSQKERKDFVKKIITTKISEPEEPVKLEGRLLIQNAGIILVAPFLYRYFDRLEMLQDQSFKTEAQACRAVQLLQFLATGSKEMQEHELVLNKILCGVPLNTPIENKVEITSEEIEVSESLLRGVLSNWNKLKTDSIDSLREGFLMREGFLEQTESGWNLEVNRKAMDILVDFIPWSFNLIKLSWMEFSVTTKWRKSLGE